MGPAGTAARSLAHPHGRERSREPARGAHRGDGAAANLPPRAAEPAGPGASSDSSGSSPGGSPTHTHPEDGARQRRPGGGGGPEAPAPRTHNTPRRTERTPNDGGHASASPGQRGRRAQHRRVVRVVTAPRPSAPRRGKARGGPEPVPATPRPGGRGVGRGGSGWGRGGTRAHQTSPKEGSHIPSHTPARADRRPHTRSADSHTKSTTRRPGGTGHDTPAGLRAHTHEHHRRHGAADATGGGGAGGGATTPPPPSTPTSQRATPPPPGAARHAEGEGRNPPLNPQDTVSPRGGETQQGHGDPGREADEKESQRDGPGPPGRRRKARQRATGEGQGHPRDDGADGRGLATRPAGPVARQSTHPHHRTRDLTASAPQGQGRSRGMGRRHPTRPTRGLRASATSTRHVSSRGESHRPPPPPSVTDRPQPHKAPAGTQARGKPSKSPPSPGGGSGQPSPQRQRGGVGAAPGPPTEGEAPEARGRGRRGSTPGHESRARQGNGHGIPPPHARAVPRRPGTPEPASGDPPRLLPRAPESPAAGAPPRDVANTRTHRTALTRHLPPIQPSGSPFPGSTGTPRERAPGVTTRPRGKRGPNTRADRRPTTASRSPGWRAGEAESRPLAPQPPGTRRTDHTRPHRQGNTTERRNTEGARTHGHTRAGPQHERATDRQPGPAGPSPNTEGGGAGRGR